jgi:hypothetical protein
MSYPIIVEDDLDLPCVDWEDTPMEVSDCPMKGKGGMCGECGWEIQFKHNQ